jgi:hypothetical protein
LTPDEQKQVVHYMIGAALEAAAAEHSDQDDEGDLAHTMTKTRKEPTVCVTSSSRAVRALPTALPVGPTTSTSLATTPSRHRGRGQKSGSLKRAVENYALQHGIENIDVLFPDAKTIDNEPEWIKRRTEWVAGVLNGTRHTPFSRIKTRSADITHEEARAKGYIKGNLKKEEFFGVTKRVTTPTTIYKKQQLDRDDMLDITDFDVVLWLKGEMRLMLEEEIARAILIGDGRDVAHEDKVKDPMGAAEGAGIRSILHDHELYVTHVNVALPAADADYNDVVEAVMRARRFYKGSGVPTFYTTTSTVGRDAPLEGRVRSSSVEHQGRARPTLSVLVVSSTLRSWTRRRICSVSSSTCRTTRLVRTGWRHLPVRRLRHRLQPVQVPDRDPAAPALSPRSSLPWLCTVRLLVMFWSLRRLRPSTVPRSRFRPTPTSTTSLMALQLLMVPPLLLPLATPSTVTAEPDCWSLLRDQRRRPVELH